MGRPTGGIVPGCRALTADDPRNRDADEPRITLVIGGMRSGKSRHAEDLVVAMPPPWTYVATAEAGDAEMAARIATHRARRGAGWVTAEAPHDLAAAVAMLPRGSAVLIDCMTLWLSNRMLAQLGGDLSRHEGRDAEIARKIDAELDAVLAAFGRHGGIAVIVSNEVGLAVVPDNALARCFCDLQGRLNQRLAAAAHRVILMVAGLPLILKQPRENPVA
jgi:adenosylcobinamide kinase / adenosylcobinamide-phosphate guanylyltransferase